MAASLTGVGAAPSVASSPIVTRPQEPDVENRTVTDRLEGVRTELENAVALGLVTADQAGSFFAQIERRIAAGL
ncbi:hypothetical protein [Arthrobacter sp.]|uniref:hypothetical protein n=1 Tax=Arthrobacter sp. TaxID=1667 RepID=UPI002810E848|nr:hypothetical protein [Arthrobacter sp.]